MARHENEALHELRSGLFQLELLEDERKEGSLSQEDFEQRVMKVAQSYNMGNIQIVNGEIDGIEEETEWLTSWEEEA